MTPLEEPRRYRAPIDSFFRTLAHSHGSVGLQHIKEARGLTAVQDPAEAAYDSLPQHVILLIYLRRNVQHAVIELFHYALRTHGYLLLGSTESIDGSALFPEFNKTYSLYQRQRWVRLSQ